MPCTLHVGARTSKVQTRPPWRSPYLRAKHPLRRARLVWPTFGQEVRNTYAHFRRDFALTRVPKSAPFFITADQAYMLYVNGARHGS